MRLKLFLSMNLLATSDPFDVRPLPARVWAEMLNLPSPKINGARRVSEAIASLQQHKLISIDNRRRGRPRRVYLRSHTGDGKPYSRPRSTWVNLPVTFWTNGWIVRLSGRAIFPSSSFCQNWWEGKIVNKAPMSDPTGRACSMDSLRTHGLAA